MEPEVQDVQQGADSSPAQPSAAVQTPPAGAQNTDTQNGATPELTPFHKHPDWQRMVRERNEARDNFQRLAQEVQQLRQSQQRPTQDGQPSPEEQQAIDALATLLKKSSWGRTLLGLSEHAPNILQGLQGVQQLTRAQQTSLINTSRREIGELAKAASLPHGDGDIDTYEDIVTGIIGRDPEALEKFQQGDTSVISAAFKRLTDGFVATLRRNSNAQLVDTKNRTRQLPPRPAGAAASPASAQPKLEPGKEREFERSLHQKARATLSELLTG